MSVWDISAEVRNACDQLPIAELRMAAKLLGEAYDELAEVATGSEPLGVVARLVGEAGDSVIKAYCDTEEALEKARAYLGSLWADADVSMPAVVATTRPPAASEIPAATLFEGTATHPDAVRKAYDDFREGWPVRVPAVAIGAIGITAAELALITNASIRYQIVNIDHEPVITSDGPIKDDATRAMASRVLGEFIRLCEADARRGGLGSINYATRQFSVRLGQFEPDAHQLRWHPDQDGGPSVRYVLSFGDFGGEESAATLFSDISITRRDIDGGGYVNDEALPRITPDRVHSHGVGVVSRFISFATVHATPKKPGKRLFMTLTVVPDDGDEESNRT